MKNNINAVVIGDKDSGKTTILGHLFSLLNLVSNVNLERNHTNSFAAFNCTGSIETSTSTGKYSWVIDSYSERYRRMTYYNKILYLDFGTTLYSLGDVPGHKKYIKNMISATSSADVSILIVSAVENEFKEGIEEGGQTREHLLIAFAYGVRQLIICINKMDLISYNQNNYDMIKNDLKKILPQVGFSKRTIVSYIPISGWFGDNLSTKSKNMQWYQGVPLLEILRILTPPTRSIDEKHLRLSINRVHRIRGTGTVITGTVVCGSVTPQDIISLPSEKTDEAYELKFIEQNYNNILQGITGDYIGLNLKASFWIPKRGMVIGTKDDRPLPIDYFIGQLIVVYHPTSIQEGFTPILYCHTGRSPCKFMRLIQKIDKKTGEVTENQPKNLIGGDAALVEMKILNPFVMEEYSKCPPLSRFVILDSNRVIAFGIVKTVHNIISDGSGKLVKRALK